MLALDEDRLRASVFSAVVALGSCFMCGSGVLLEARVVSRPASFEGQETGVGVFFPGEEDMEAKVCCFLVRLTVFMYRKNGCLG